MRERLCECEFEHVDGQGAAEQAIILYQHQVRCISDESFLQQHHLPIMLSQYFVP